MPDITMPNAMPPIAGDGPVSENSGIGVRPADAGDIQMFNSLMGNGGEASPDRGSAAFFSPAGANGSEAAGGGTMYAGAIKSFSGGMPGGAEAFGRQDTPLSRSDSLFTAEDGRLPANDVDQKSVLENESPNDAAALRDLFSGMMRPAETFAAGRTEQAAAPAPANAADHPQLEKIVERILVSAPDQGGQEVRITLSSQALQGTDIILHRNVTGELSVTLQTGDPRSFQTLVASQGELKQLLETQEKGEVRVTVAGDTPQEQNDSNRRSRGYTSYENDELSARG